MRKIPEYLLVVFNCLLAILVIFESRVSAPGWLTGGGRMHPLVLHLPIGLWAAVLVLYGLRRRFPEYRSLLGIFLKVTALFTALTALSGMFLVLGGGYEEVGKHQYAGVALSFLLWLTVIFFDKIPSRLLPVPLAVISAAVVATGHLGGVITHGEDFLRFAPEKASAPVDDVYRALVVPILQEKCGSCHNESKAKGELNLASVGHMLKGGESGPALVAGNALESHLMQRIFLPLEDEEHMPPRKKKQLTEAEIEILTAWINAGAPENLSFSALDPESLLTRYRPAVEHYTFAAADAAKIAAVNTPFCRVRPVALNSPALEAAFFVRARFDAGHLEELLAVKDQLVTLNLSKMPVKDDDLAVLARFRQLEDLNLSGTEVTGDFLRYVKDLSQLKSVSLANTRLKSPDLAALARVPVVYLWESGLTTEDIARLKELNPAIRIDVGQRETEQVAINPPESTEKNVFLEKGTPVVLRHVLPGVLIKYTLDGTVPDSGRGETYARPLTVEGRTRVKARAFKEGWLGSPVLDLDFLVAGPAPDSAVLLSAPAAQYAGRGARSLYDHQKGDPDNFLDKTWLGYQDKPLEAVFYFRQPREIKGLTVSMLENASSYIMPPESIEVWGKTASGKEQFLGRVLPEALPALRPRRNTYIDLSIPPQEYKEIRVRVNNIRSLPGWHPGKGTPGWVFVDEVVFN